jgi:hypothetical protein
MTDRHTADSINDNDLDQLYTDLAHAQAEAARWAEAESADVAAGSYAGRVEELQTVIDRVRALHRRNEHTGTCEHCSARDYPDYAVSYPCDTIRALDQEHR